MMKTYMKTYVLAAAAAGSLWLMAGGVACAATLELTDSGIGINAGADARYTLAYPLPVNAAKKNAKIESKKIEGRKAMLSYEGGGKAELELGDAEIAVTFSEMPEDTKLVCVVMRIPTADGAGVKWSIGGTASGELPKDKPAKPFLFQGNAKTLELISLAGAKTALQIPDYSYQQLQDNREWGGGVFQWLFWAPYF